MMKHVATRNEILGAGLMGGMQGAMTKGGGTAGVVTVLLLFMGIPSLLLVWLGAWIASGRSALAEPGSIALQLELALLLVLAICAWTVRVPLRPVALASAVGYLLSGLGVLVIEARTAASSTTGVWPTLSYAWWEVLVYWIDLGSSMLGKALIFSTMALPFVMAQAWDVIKPRAASAREPSAAATHRAGSPDAPMALQRAEQPRLCLDDLAGMQPLKLQLREFAARFAGYSRKGAPASDVNGLLLSGPPGNGKTVFAEALAGELGFGFIKVGVQDLTSQWLNDSANRVREVFAAACASEPCVLFLDEFDAVGRKRAAGPTQHAEDTKLVDALLTQIDDIRSRRVVLVAATNHPEELDAALVRPGRFDCKIEIPLPDLEARLGILTALLAKFRVRADADAVQAAAQLWEQRSVAFLEAVAKRLRDELARSHDPKATAAHLKSAARAVSRREGAIPKAGTRLSQLTLPAATMREVRSIVYRLKHWEELAARGGTPPRGVLIYGPPGTGKTSLARAVALELGDWHLFEVKTPDIAHDPRKFQDVLTMATEHRPAIVFIDEADDLLRDRSYSPTATATSEILKAMDGAMALVPEVVFFAATNNPAAIDAAAMRGGRFSDKILMDLLRGAELETFVSAELERRPRFAFAHDLTARWIRQVVQEIGAADLVAALDQAVNTTLQHDTQHPVDRARFAAALAAVRGLKTRRADTP